MSRAILQLPQSARKPVEPAFQCATKTSACKLRPCVPSGAKREWPRLNRVLEHLRVDHTLVVWKLDRPECSVKDLVESSQAILW